MANEDVSYEVKTVQTMRGTEARSIAKWQKTGWELVEQDKGTLRTTLSFRRTKPKFPLFPLAMAGGALALIAAIIGIGVALEGGSGGGGSETTMPKSETTVVASEPPFKKPEASASESASPDLDQTGSDHVLTVANNEELAALMKVGDTCDESIARFADKYAGMTIEFDGSIAHMANYGDYDTRYDILLGPGDDGPETGFGPALKFEDVNMGDLNLLGENQPDHVGAGDLFHFVAEVGEFNPVSCLFMLEPVSTQAR